MFLLGAGASVDAGIPAVQGLTRDLRRALPQTVDFSDTARPQFAELFDRICNLDPEVCQNYEKFFLWLVYLREATGMFRAVTKIDFAPELLEAAQEFPWIARREIAKLFQNYPSNHSYFAGLGSFIPDVGHLKIFSLNYDCCVEDCCAESGINIVTGFDQTTKRWNVPIFDRAEKGINFYKLHGSLRWFGSQDEQELERAGMWANSYCLLELRESEKLLQPKTFGISPEPTLILGPRSKLQPDNPFLHLFYEFHRGLEENDVCIVIGYSYQDEHINETLENALKRGVRILDVNIGDPRKDFASAPCFSHLKAATKFAFEQDLIRKEIAKF